MTTMGELCCEVCGITSDVTALHRANPKGEKGRWRCEADLGKPVEPDVLRVTDAVQLGVDPSTLDGVTVIGGEQE